MTAQSRDLSRAGRLPGQELRQERNWRDLKNDRPGEQQGK